MVGTRGSGNKRMFDVVVIGAGCTGAASALLSARAGSRVLLLEKSGFPTDPLSTLYLQPPGVDLLARWGVLDRITAGDCPRLDRITYGLGDVVLEGPTPTLGLVTGTYAPKRPLLDGALVDAAIDAGAEFRARCKLVGLVGDGDQVTGVRYADRDGRLFTESAHLVVGADGMRSTVAELTGARTTEIGRAHV